MVKKPWILARGWKESGQTLFCNVAAVSILIILANGWKANYHGLFWLTDNRFQSSSYWRVAGKFVSWMALMSPITSFNPHHTGVWLKSIRNEQKNLLDAGVSILIILAVG